MIVRGFVCAALAMDITDSEVESSKGNVCSSGMDKTLRYSNSGRGLLLRCRNPRKTLKVERLRIDE